MEATCRQLMLFTEASLNDPVKTSRSQGNRRDLKEHDQASGLKCCESSQSADPLSSLLKMCVERSISPSIPCTPVWSEKVTKSTRTSFQHLRLVRPTKGKDSSSSESGAMWPTARASDYKGCGPHGSKSQKYMLGKSYLCATVSEAENSGLLHQSTGTTTERE